MGVVVGLTRHHTWGLVVPLLASLSPMVLSRYAFDGVPTAVNALIAGGVVAGACWVLMSHVPLFTETHALSKAVLCGLLVAEVMVLSPSNRLPTMTALTLWLFFYFYSVENHH